MTTTPPDRNLDMLKAFYAMFRESRTGYKPAGTLADGIWLLDYIDKQQAEIDQLKQRIAELEQA